MPELQQVHSSGCPQLQAGTPLLRQTILHLALETTSGKFRLRLLMIAEMTGRETLLEQMRKGIVTQL